MAEDPFFYVYWKGKTLDDLFPWRTSCSHSAGLRMQR